MKQVNNFNYKSLYFDGAANTPLDKEVFAAMRPFLSSSYVGNSFAIHSHGIYAMNTVEVSRKMIADDLGVKVSEVYFTSGATESNNWILQALCCHELTKEVAKRKNHIVLSATEHSSVLKVAEFLKTLGFEISYVKPVDGRIDRKAIRKVITKNTLLVSVVAVNNETGIKNDVSEIGKYVHRLGALMMSDVTQALSLGGDTMDLSKQYPYVDYLTFSGHKLYGPLGIGCLIARDSAPLYPFIYGGPQELGKRGGTSNVAGIVGLSKAIDLLRHADYYKHYKDLYDYLTLLFNKELGGLPKINFVPDHPNIVSVDFSKMFDSSMLAQRLAMEGISCSAGSACGSTDAENNIPSHVLVAYDLPLDVIQKTIRLSFTKFTTKKDIKDLCLKLKALYESDLAMKKLAEEQKKSATKASSKRTKSK